MCLVSIGYKGIPIAGTEDYYDHQKGILNNDHEVVDNNNESTTTGLAPLYVSGWLKRGPSGIIGTNITDAKETVASIMNVTIIRGMFFRIFTQTTRKTGEVDDFWSS